MKLIICLVSLWASVFIHAQTATNKILIDQFGYRPSAKKVAVVKNPQTGQDATEIFAPATNYKLVNAENDQVIFASDIVIWNGGAEDASSGDKVWWFDFSEVTTIGEYYILDETNGVKSHNFEIKESVYAEPLKHAVRTFFYQRSGHEKSTQFAGDNWADGASHIGSLQDKNCRKWDSPNDASSEIDVHGGWYDAGDYNKYTGWTANYIIELLRAYRENPDVWADDYNIPESGNGTPDIIDEVKWGLDNLLRLQLNDGSMISIVDAAHASPPSSATERSLYGDVNTSATIASAGAFASGAIVFDDLGMATYADQCKRAAEDAWNWVEANPNVIWRNNDWGAGTQGIGAGQQEVDDYKRLIYKLRAAVYLLKLTGASTYKTFFDDNYDQVHLMQWSFAYSFEDEEQDILLEYADLDGATSSVANTIKSTYSNAMDGSDNFAAYENSIDPYRTYLKDYTWGSNRQKSALGNMFYAVKQFGVNPAKAELGLEVAEEYLHYLHGVNPLGIMYLSNMYEYGGDHCVDQFYHTWFYDGTDWDEYGVSKYGPAPGFLVGGPNPQFSVDGCCPSGCGSAENNTRCNFDGKDRVLDQPDQKSYVDFNDNWPANSWEITENSGGYQVEYIRLLSKFVALEKNTSGLVQDKSAKIKIYPNPSADYFTISGGGDNLVWELIDGSGKVVLRGVHNIISAEDLDGGVYYLRFMDGDLFGAERLIVLE